MHGVPAPLVLNPGSVVETELRRVGHSGLQDVGESGRCSENAAIDVDTGGFDRHYPSRFLIAAAVPGAL
jgi:hypothetical protein